jgi:hypothetical protein
MIRIFLTFESTGQLMGALYQPKSWPTLAHCLTVYEMGMRSDAFVNELDLAFCSSSIATIQRDGGNGSNKPVSYAFQAVTCADAIDAGGVTTKMVLTEILGVGLVVDQICKQLYPSLRSVRF